ncbi:CBS domain-containing protein [Nocardiopsis nanhaiensis]
MVDSVAEVMTGPVRVVAPKTTLREAAEIMRYSDVGDVVVAEGGHLRGILTDRDIVVRCIAEGGDPGRVRAGEVCSSDVVTVPRHGSVGDAVHAMRAGTIRRLPVVEGDEVVGVVTMGDLARVVDDRSALADVTVAEPNH